MNDQPELFHMHENADITYANNETQRLFNTIISIQPRQDVESFKIDEDLVAEKLEGI